MGYCNHRGIYRYEIQIMVELIQGNPWYIVTIWAFTGMIYRVVELIQGNPWDIWQFHKKMLQHE